MTEIKPQFIQAAGVELVILTRAEYDELMARFGPEAEDASDAEIFEARISELLGGQDERLPVEVTTSILEGDSLLRALRKWRRKSQTEMARMIDLDEAQLGAIETGMQPGADDVLRKAAAALDVPFAWLAPD